LPEGREGTYSVVLFHSVSGALRAEKLIKEAGIEYKLIPVPRHLSSDCGLCLRFRTEDEGRVREILRGKVEVQDICPL